MIALFISDVVETCTGNDFRGSCAEQEVIVMQSAKMGRMESGTCIHGDRFIGCTNNVLYVLDQLCSGRHRCELIYPNSKLKKANSECEDFLEMYLTVDYVCLKGNRVLSYCRGDSTCSRIFIFLF